jgi:hypothetical protein
MAYTSTFSMALGASKAGLTLAAQIMDTTGANVGSEITAGFVEIGGGAYMLTASIPDSHRGGLKVYQSGVPATILAFAAINPEELEPETGGGAITFTYTLTSSVDAVPIADADVWVTSDLAGTNILASGKTNQNGVVTFYLDAGTVYVWRSKSGWDFTNPDTEVVA